MRRAALASAPLIVAMALLAGCSANDEPADGAPAGAAAAPVDATEEDYCAATDSLAEHVMSTTTDRDEFMAGMKEWADEMRAVGTPKTFSDEAREGYVQTIDLLQSLDPQLDPAGLADLEAGQSQAEKDAAAAFDEATIGLCGSPLDNLELPEIPTPSS